MGLGFRVAHAWRAESNCQTVYGFFVIAGFGCGEQLFNNSIEHFSIIWETPSRTLTRNPLKPIKTSFKNVMKTLIRNRKLLLTSFSMPCQHGIFNAMPAFQLQAI